MIDRSYLPFQSAREYQDVKMQKWMGFFLSEHSSALIDDNNIRLFYSGLTLEQKLLILSQIYSQQTTARLSVVGNSQIRNYIGTIPTVNREYLLLKTKEGHINIRLNDIISIEPIQEVVYESA
ncbi:hypothetical protein [Streptococcus suis]|uniref:YolD-like protein n=1 Tax=Streptococcus suis TaxID=1307 RepID=A0AAN2RFY0_STRSU|nr:hypothetical protein [Streptococcus suis]NQH73578.1 hypothetical protein [Streptococcus suis]CYU69776.1 YolD-like protein [Streptococcus suis]HEL1648536.1 hypothetical protein [Streptococcus suis]